MNSEKREQLLSKASLSINKAIIFLSKSLPRMDSLKVDVNRRALVIYSLLKTGVSPITPIVSKSIESNLEERLEDNCFRSIQDNAFILLALKQLPEYGKEKKALTDYLVSNQNKEGGWGHYSRDKSRIPVSAITLYALSGQAKPEEISKSVEWVEREWAKDMEEEAALTYKGALTLLAFGELDIKNSFTEKTIEFMLGSQKNDGGWSAGKNSIIPSVPSYTAYALLGLLEYVEPLSDPIVSAAEFLLKNQHPSGQWVEHPFEKSAYSMMALNEVKAWLKK